MMTAREEFILKTLKRMSARQTEIEIDLAAGRLWEVRQALLWHRSTVRDLLSLFSKEQS